MSNKDIYVPIHINILTAVTEIQKYLELELQISASKQDIIENAIMNLKIQFLN